MTTDYIPDDYRDGYFIVRKSEETALYGFKIFEEHVAIDGMVPDVVCFKLHHSVNFICLVCADVMESRKDQEIPDFPGRIFVCRF